VLATGPKSYFVGAYHANASSTSPSPFLIIKNTNFQNSYAGMLAWEGYLYDDFGWILSNKGIGARATRYGNTTVFSDALVHNKDTRILKDISGSTLIVYAFADNDTIVIAPNEDILSKIIDLLEKRAFVRQQ
jgi:hypothetical protein